MMTVLFQNDGGPGHGHRRRAADEKRLSQHLMTCAISHGWNTLQSEKQKR
jgi:hypothetical protein